MAIDGQKFAKLCHVLSEIDLWGTAPPAPPWGAAPTEEGFRQAIQSARAFLPLLYQQAYADPILVHAPHILIQAWAAETVAGAVYDHAPALGVMPGLNRFLAVISNFYRSFLSAKRRAKARFPIVETLPPVAMFQHKGEDGPFTLPADDMLNLCGTKVGAVSLPSTYRDHPVLWASLAHETGGHDVLHADEGLLAELAAGTYKLFGGGPIKTGDNLTMEQFLGLLWGYWIDEAASDVYGLLNIGPAFALNLAAFFSALNSPRGKGRPSLRIDSGPDERGWLDPHPTDIVRLHLAIGALREQSGLAAGARQAYEAELVKLSTLCDGKTQSVRLQGSIPITHDRALRVNTGVPLTTMQASAVRVGGYITTAKLASLGKHCIREIESWDDADEGATLRIAGNLAKGQSVSGLGDDAQLLAGATLALTEDPGRYAAVTHALNDALDLSFELDPFWGNAKRDRAYIRTTIASPPPASRGWLAEVKGPAKVRSRRG